MCFVLKKHRKVRVVRAEKDIVKFVLFVLKKYRKVRVVRAENRTCIVRAEERR